MSEQATHSADGTPISRVWLFNGKRAEDMTRKELIDALSRMADSHAHLCATYWTQRT